MKIVFVSHSFYSPYFVVGSHHLARQMARRGHTVWHISAIPFSHLFHPLHDYKVRCQRFFQGVIQLEPNLKEAVIRPFLPWQVTRRLHRWGNLFVQLSDLGLLTRAYPELRHVDLLIIDEPRLNGIQGYIKADSLYYRPTDLYAELKGDPSIQETEDAILSESRGIIATSQPVLERMLKLRPALPHLLLINGVEAAFSSIQSEPASLKNIGHPRVVYVGAIDQRLDIRAIQFLAATFPLVSFIVLGDGSHHEQLEAIAAANIHFLGLVPHAELSAYLQHGDVGLLPLVKIRSNEGRSPMKLYEYGMSGLVVLASRTPEMERRKEDFIELYSTHQEAAERLAALLSTRRDRAGMIVQCGRQSWENKAAQLESFVMKCSGGP
jgi:glycosyltransferase involved in cell wall biosynthesis